MCTRPAPYADLFDPSVDKAQTRVERSGVIRVVHQYQKPCKYTARILNSTRACTTPISPNPYTRTTSFPPILNSLEPSVDKL